MVKEILINDYDYNLPEASIPKHPIAVRDECKLLVRSPFGVIYHKIFKDLPNLLPPGSLLVCNDTKVINARLTFFKSTGAAIELFLLEPVVPADYALSFQSREHCRWKCLVGNSKKWKDGEISTSVPVDEENEIQLMAIRHDIAEDGSSEVDFFWNDPEFNFAQVIEMAGKIPIPPYLNRETEDSDLTDYQTVYARVKGSVAAPTAGLHFTPNVFDNLRAHAVDIEKVTLHVGAGTFRPVKSDAIGEHQMHAEPFTINRVFLEKLIEWKASGRPVVAVGTTSVRTLESLPYIGRAILRNSPNPFVVDQWEAYDSEEFDTLEALKLILEKL